MVSGCGYRLLVSQAGPTEYRQANHAAIEPSDREFRNACCGRQLAAEQRVLQYSGEGSQGLLESSLVGLAVRGRYSSDQIGNSGAESELRAVGIGRASCRERV